MFIWLIIRLIQLVFSAETVFFSHKKSANSIFQPGGGRQHGNTQESLVKKLISVAFYTTWHWYTNAPVFTNG
jgi:hypothetical protein